MMYYEVINKDGSGGKFQTVNGRSAEKEAEWRKSKNIDCYINTRSTEKDGRLA